MFSSGAKERPRAGEPCPSPENASASLLDKFMGE